ncbi:uncharacterized protein stbd1 [Syngnathoides biaculeatus]|uniref:uncharacterized protein stbd1 n=1 Tax=Syngnathoides biaculeatus TaxID=300417 RepID=UPI002ADE2673|nr:uncharacterized protein stbd1 [Syngnathoides biaculeatus]
MAFKDGNGVAVERRVDLASLFCMIGRHGPAVTLALFAMVSVLAGLVIYRTVTGRRRRRKKEASDRAEGRSPPAESDEGAPQAGREPQACGASTDVDVIKEDDDDPAGTVLKVRHRATAAPEKSPLIWASDVQEPLDQHATSPLTQQVESVPSSFREAKVYLEEPSQSLQSIGAEIQEEPTTDCHLYSTDDSFRDERISEGSLKEPESIRDQIYHEEVYNAEIQVDKVVTTEEFNSDNKKARQEEETSKTLSSNKVCFEKTHPIRDVAYEKQDDKIAAESRTVELNIEGHVISDKSRKDDFEEVIQHQDSADEYAYSSDCFATEEEKKHAVINEEQETEDDRNSTQSPPLDNSEIQVECEEEHSLTSNQEMDLLSHECELVEGCNIVSSMEDVSSSIPPLVDNDILGIASEETPQINSVSDITNDQQAQKEVPTVEDEPPMPSDDTENLSEMIQKTTVTTQDEVPVELHTLSSEEQQNVQELDRNALKTTSIAFLPDLTCDIEASIYKNHYGDNTENSTVFEQPRFDSLGDTDASDNNFHEDIASSSQDQENYHKADDFSFIVAAPVVSEDTMTPPKLQITLPLFEPSERTDNNICGGGEESGISSMAVSPELLDPGINFDTNGIPAKVHESKAEAKLEPQTCLFVDDATLSALEDDAMVHERHPVPLPEQPCSQIIDSAYDESSGAKEGMFAHVIEDKKRERDLFTVPVRSDDLERRADMKVAVVSGVKKLESVENKEPKMEKDDCAKTEINIMEATMDHNEWITDGNPNFPWMNLSLPSFGGEKHTSSELLHTEESNHPNAEPQSVQVKQIDGWDFEENVKTKSVNVTFRVHYLTRSPFQILAVTGNRLELGSWKEFIPLESAKDGYWMGVVRLPAEHHVQWKFVVVEKGAVCRWEECGNRLLNTDVAKTCSCTNCGDFCEKGWGNDHQACFYLGTKLELLHYIEMVTVYVFIAK